MKLAYDASSEILGIDVDLQSRRANSLCIDPRADRSATCLKAHIAHLPQHMEATYDPSETDTAITFDSSNPLSTDLMSITGLELLSTSPADGVPPLTANLDITDITKHLRINILKQDLDTPADDVLDMAKVRFDACPILGEACDGIGVLEFMATNALVASALPPTPPAPASEHSVSFVTRGGPFRAEGKIQDLKQLEFRKVDADDEPSPVTHLRAAFGDDDNDALRGYIDGDDGSSSQLIDMRIDDLPAAMNVCLRDSAAAADLKPPSPNVDYCERLNADPDPDPDDDKFALQFKLDEPGVTQGHDKPMIHVEPMRLGKGTSVMTGKVHIDDLGERIDVLAGKGGKPNILIEGHEINDDINLAEVVGRITLELRNFEGADPTAGYPWEPLDRGVGLDNTVDPEADPRNDDNSSQNPGRNYLKLMSSGPKMIALASIPKLKQIRLKPDVCDANDTRFPLLSGYGANQPEYNCIAALFAEHRPFGAAVRTIDLQSTDVLSLDDVHVNSMPAGGGGLRVTLTKSPEALALEPVCGPGDQAPCRPVMLSVEALQAPNQFSRLEGRLATGPYTMLEGQLKPAIPMDNVSQRLLYNKRPHEYEHDGVRIKAGSRELNGEKQSAIRAGLKIELPNYLDLDPLTSYACKHVAPGNNTSCNDADARPTRNLGFEAKDIFFKLVAADDHHDGSVLNSNGGYLGRVAVLVNSFGNQPSQVVLTGAPPVDGPDGTTMATPENPPAQGVIDQFGMNMPGHIDARIYLRDKYHSAVESQPQVKYAQVDGRVSEPLSLGIRLNAHENGTARSGASVPATSLALRNAPDRAGDDYTQPTFRVRAEIRKKHYVTPRPRAFNCGTEGVGVSGSVAGFGGSLCLLTPSPELKWMDLVLNFDPDGPNGQDPARTIDAVVDPKGAKNDVDIRSFKEVNGSGQTSGKGDDATSSVQAALRLWPFNIGLKVGLGLGIVGGYTTFQNEGDLIVGIRGLANAQTRLAQNIGALRLKSRHAPNISTGMSVVTPDLRSRIRLIVYAEALFGLLSGEVLNVSSNEYQQGVSFFPCDFHSGHAVPGSLPGSFTSADQVLSRKRSLHLDGAPLGSGGSTFVAVSNFLAPIWCLLGTDDGDMVAHNHPAPAMTEPGRPIENSPIVSNLNPPGVVGNPGETRTDLTIGPNQPGQTQPVTLCGVQSAKTLRVESGGTLRVGAESETINVSVPDPEGGPPTIVQHDCDGTLRLEVDELIVENGGIIDASGTMDQTAGPGHPVPLWGGGAGNVGHGGKGAGIFTGGNPYLATQQNPAPAGSRGRVGLGSLPGGDGGGKLQVSAMDRIHVYAGGEILARGGTGADGTQPGCNGIGSGGGSGGGIVLQANHVQLDGSVSAAGGNGGAGDKGGGGGSGGRVIVNSVVRSGAPTADGGLGGVHNTQGCSGQDGTDGDPGDASLGTSLQRAAGVTVSAVHESPWVKNAVDLDIEAVQDGGPLRVVICRQTVPLNGSQGFDDPGLNASLLPIPSHAVDDYDGCISQPFNNGPTNQNGYLYRDTVTWAGLPEGYHAFYAFAAAPDAGGITALGWPQLDPEDVDCFGEYHGVSQADHCDFQLIAPRTATAKIAADQTAPNVTVGAPNGVPGCPGTSLCLTSPSGTVDLPLTDTHSGPAETLCSNHGGPYDISCTGAPVNISLDEGLNEVWVRGWDAVDNATTVSVAKWFVDTKKPQPPVVTLTPNGPNNNGWYLTEPDIEVHASETGADPSGFGAGAITLLVDGAGNPCGTGGASTAQCLPADTQSLVPSEGEHHFRARAIDIAGNESDLSNEVIMRVDNTKPDSRLFLGPEDPDGDHTFYKTHPVIAFAGSDTPGGSGVLIREHIFPDNNTVSGVYFSVDGAPFGEYAEDSPGNFLPNGTHDLCWYAIDLAGNQQDTECENDIKVDANAPTPTLVMSGSSGANGWYVGQPTYSLTTTDTGGSGVDNSGNFLPSGTFVSIDGAPYTRYNANANQIGDGNHEVCYYAIDKAGNLGSDGSSPTDPNCVRVKVDSQAPPSPQLYLDAPSPDGDNGWYRTRPSVMFAARDTGADASGVDISLLTPTSRVRYSLDGGVFQDFNPNVAVILNEGDHELCYRSIDIAGNGGTVRCTEVKVDSIAPNPLLALSGPNGSHGWFDTHPPFSLNTIEAGSGVETHLTNTRSGEYFQLDDGSVTRFDSQTTNTLGDGDRQLCYYAIDRAGNVGVEGGGQNMICRNERVDTQAPEAPQMYTDPVEPDGNNGWFRTAPRLTLAANDRNAANASGVEPGNLPSLLRYRVDGGAFQDYNPSAPPTLTDGEHDVCFYAVDVAGNPVNAPVVTCKHLKVDTTAPGAAATIAPLSPNGTNSWYTSTPTVTPSGSDAPGASGVDRTEYQVDDGAWTTSAPFTMPQGEHEYRVRTFDLAGNESPMVERTVRVDLTNPTVRPGHFPPVANDQGWFRQRPLNSIAARDARDNSGPDGASYILDGGAPVSYLNPFTVNEGQHTLSTTSRDLSGRTSAAVAENERVDLTAPTGAPVGQAANVIVQILGLPFYTNLHYTAGDARTPRVKVSVFVYNALGFLVRRLPVNGPHPGGYRDAGAGSVAWDARTALNTGVLPGPYHYRVHVTDQAGNTVLSDESPPFLVVLGVLPLGLLGLF